MLFAIVGAAGNVILFVCFSVAFLIVGSYTLTYLAHCYLVVVQGTTAGIDRVEWPDEPVYDWLLQVVWLAAIVGFWLGPLGLLARGLSETFLPEQPFLRYALIMGGGLWLIVPIGLLSALASNYWVPFSLRVFLHLFRLAPAVLAFYLSAAVLVVLALAAVWGGLLWNSWLALPFAAAIGASTCLIHARLIGRLGWLLSELKQRDAAPLPRKKRKTVKKKARMARGKAQGVAVEDPWADPEDEDADAVGATEEGYGLVSETKEEAKPPRPSYLDPEPEPYEMAQQEEELPGKAALEERTQLDKAMIERELKLRERKPPNPPPTFPMVEGIWTFPFYESTLKAWIAMVVYLLFAGGVLRLVVQTAPF